MMRSTALLLTSIFTVSAPALAQDMEGVEPLDRADALEEVDPLDLLEQAGMELPERLAPTIINGAAVGDDAWPAAGGLLGNITFSYQGQQATFPMFMCSSTLIAPDVVLTAAHCVDQDFLELQFSGLPVDIVNVQYAWSAQEDLSGYGLGGQTSLPEGAGVGSEWVQNHGWVGVFGLNIRIAENHDIALIFLDEPVLDVEPALLPLPEEASQVVAGAPITIVGWGNQRPVPQGQQPAPGNVGIRRAADTVIGEVGLTEFQAGTTIETGRKCQGDSGGPTFMEVETESIVTTRVIGVTSHSWDETQCESKGGVDTRVDFYLDWIDAEMRAACEDGIRTACDEPGILKPEFPVVEDEEVDGAKACGCSAPATPASLVALFGALGLVLARRRRS